LIAVSQHQSTDATLRQAMAASTSTITMSATYLCMREEIQTYVLHLDVLTL
jgi:fructose-1-phosphate kinase PfkB-like protein